MSELTEKLVEIAGFNALGIQNEEISNLSKALKYLEFQVSIAIKDIENQDDKASIQDLFSDACLMAVKILSKDEA